MRDFPQLSDEELARLIQAGESDRVEFKERMDPIAVREAVCAFANDMPGSRQPGYVLIGVDDRGVPSGLRVDDELLRQLADIKTDGNIVPFPSILVEKRSLPQGDVALVAVMPSDSPPVRYKGLVCIRVGSRRGIATPEEELRLAERRRARLLPFDIQPMPGATLSELNTALFVQEYLPAAVAPEMISQNDRSVEQRLIGARMCTPDDPPIPTVLGLLVCGMDPQTWLPGAHINFVRYDGLDLTAPIVTAHELTGTLGQQLRMVDEVLRANIRLAVDIESGDKEQVTPDFPLVALQQVVRNALMHRTYEGTFAPVRIRWFHDRVEVWSPGGPFGQVTTQNFGQEGLTDYRNPHIAEAMKVLGYVQKFGVGIALARKALRDNGNPLPTFDPQPSYVQVTIRARQ